MFLLNRFRVFVGLLIIDYGLHLNDFQYTCYYVPPISLDSISFYVRFAVGRHEWPLWPFPLLPCTCANLKCEDCSK